MAVKWSVILQAAMTTIENKLMKMTGDVQYLIRLRVAFAQIEAIFKDVEREKELMGVKNEEIS